MPTENLIWPIVTGALGVALKSVWDIYVGWQDKIRMETWKIHTHQLEERLSKFYWPLYVRLVRDDNVWKKVFYDLQGDGPKPKNWVEALKPEKRNALAEEIEKSVLLPNHAEAVKIITSYIHLSEADHEFRKMLLRYVRHVDVYQSLRSAGLNDVAPISVDEEYPSGLSKVVGKLLFEHRQEYDKLLLERPTLLRASPLRIFLIRIWKSIIKRLGF